MKKNDRYALLDALRGLCLLSMIAYHAVYDLVVLYGVRLPWYFDTPGYLWQQSICWGFILLSGVSWHFGRSPLKRGLLVSACGLGITLVTALFMPSQRIVMGVLSLLGASALLMIPLDRALLKVDPRRSAGLSAALFFLTRNIGEGFLGFEGIRLFQLPGFLYTLPGGFILGLPGPDFYSSDYFALMPWFFLFAFGHFFWRGLSEESRVKAALRLDVPILSPLGRKSLIIYLLHQPLTMLVLTVALRR